MLDFCFQCPTAIHPSAFFFPLPSQPEGSCFIMIYQSIFCTGHDSSTDGMMKYTLFFSPPQCSIYQLSVVWVFQTGVFLVVGWIEIRWCRRRWVECDTGNSYSWSWDSWHLTSSNAIQRCGNKNTTWEKSLTPTHGGRRGARGWLIMNNESRHYVNFNAVNCNQCSRKAAFEMNNRKDGKLKLDLCKKHFVWMRGRKLAQAAKK